MRGSPDVPFLGGLDPATAGEADRTEDLFFVDADAMYPAVGAGSRDLDNDSRDDSGDSEDDEGGYKPHPVPRDERQRLPGARVGPCRQAAPTAQELAATAETSNEEAPEGRVAEREHAEEDERHGGRLLLMEQTAARTDVPFISGAAEL